MNDSPLHTFHIPVLGIAYSIDTPFKVAKYGISSVISIMDDQLIERMREYHAKLAGKPFEAIPEKDPDHRAKRITAYLNLADEVVNDQIAHLQTLPFGDNDLTAWFELLPGSSPVRRCYERLLAEKDPAIKTSLQAQLRQLIAPGSIDVNVMSKIDRNNYDESGNELPEGFSDALAAFRGFACSTLSSSIVFSAGYNPRLYNYIDHFADFFPDANGILKKKIILKVSDFRSALVQGRLLAKKGVWISEFRIESGLNCGGHAFPTDGHLMGPILAEFRDRREELRTELFAACQAALEQKGWSKFSTMPLLRITAQGGIGTAAEQAFLLEHYALDSTGWGSPFLLVPEATNVDEETLQKLAGAKKEDYYTSYASPLGIAFNNFRPSSGQKNRMERIDKDRPGSPCYKKFLATNTEFTSQPVCTASREYQHLKIKELEARDLQPAEYQAEFDKITEKECLCEGLGASVLIKDGLPLSHNLPAVTICPGPNLAYFSGVFSLAEMVGHIYGRANLLNKLPRPNLFISELNMYVDHFKKMITGCTELNPRQAKQFQTFRNNLLSGIEYYHSTVQYLKNEGSRYIALMQEQLALAAEEITLQDQLIGCPA